MLNIELNVMCIECMRREKIKKGFSAFRASFRAVPIPIMQSELQSNKVVRRFMRIPTENYLENSNIRAIEIMCYIILTTCKCSLCLNVHHFPFVRRVIFSYIFLIFNLYLYMNILKQSTIYAYMLEVSFSSIHCDTLMWNCRM